jgi:hypothetical protein
LIPLRSQEKPRKLLTADENANYLFFLIMQNSERYERWLKNSLLFVGVLSFFWLALRTGTKPTRITYPCQRAAVDNLSLSLGSLAPLSLTPILMKFRWTSVVSVITKSKTFISKHWKPIAALLIIVPGVAIGGALLWRGMHPEPPPNGDYITPDRILTLNAITATILPASDIYVVNSRSVAHISNLIDLMSSHDFLFYQSDTIGPMQGPSGLIAHDDVVLLKINSQWPYRGGTNTDMLRELIQAIVNHPDGFIGEIVVADNGQSFGSLDWEYSNSENHDQSTQDIVNQFSSSYHVSTYDWQVIRGTRVSEYSRGDTTDGYILYDTPDPESGIYVSYPKFCTSYGTLISFKNGIWNGEDYEDRLKVINLPVLKSHWSYGVTASLKNYMGVQSEGDAVPGGLANGHNSIATGGLGTLMIETGLPTLTILDAIWINANPYPSLRTGPETEYSWATRVNVLLASTDPVALDYWAAKHVLMQAAEIIGYSDTHTLDPDNTQRSGLQEAFGVYLNLSKNEILSAGYSVTASEDHMNVYVRQPHRVLEPLDDWPIKGRHNSIPEVQGMNPMKLQEIQKFIINDNKHIHSMLSVCKEYLVSKFHLTQEQNQITFHKL